MLPASWSAWFPARNDPNEMRRLLALLAGSLYCAVFGLLDDRFTLADIETTDVALTVTGIDGFVLEGRSAMSAISRPPADLVAQAINDHHRYPDGLVLYLGTMFAPTEDRDAEGKGFTHQEGDVVRISCDPLGALVNRVAATDACAPWTFGTAALMRNLAARGLL